MIQQGLKVWEVATTSLAAESCFYTKTKPHKYRHAWVNRWGQRDRDTNSLPWSVRVSGRFSTCGSWSSPFWVGPPAPQLHFICKQSAGKLLKPVQPPFPRQFVMLSTAVTRLTSWNSFFVFPCVQRWLLPWFELTWISVSSPCLLACPPVSLPLHLGLFGNSHKPPLLIACKPGPAKQWKSLTQLLQ